MLNITVSKNCTSEREWIISVIFSKFLGINYCLTFSDCEYFLIEADGKVLKINDSFFRNIDGNWLDESTLPSQPTEVWNTKTIPWDVNLVSSLLPVIYGKGGMVLTDGEVTISLDILGSAFFMLSRYEELVIRDRDKHDRFPAKASLAYQEGFLDRPIINEYLEILWACMKYLWPELRRKNREFQLLITADVDQPYARGIRNPLHQISQIAGDLIIRRNPIMAVHSGINYFKSKYGDFSYDPYYSIFDWMMNVNENAGNQMVFYFMAGRSDEKMDGCYSLDEPVIRKLMRRVHKRGHEIGIHPSYNTYKEADRLNREVRNIFRVLDDEGIQHEKMGGRQHYLRWEVPTTAYNYEAAGLVYDSTLSYADHTGFRCGICYEYPFYDVIKHHALKIHIRPLIVMDCSLLSKNYMNCDTKEATTILSTLKKNCKLFDGLFVLLWHNSYLMSPLLKNIYTRIVSK